MEHNKYERLRGELQVQKWMNVKAEEGHREGHPCQCPMLPGGVLGGDGGCPGALCHEARAAGQWGQDHWQWDSPYLILLLLLPPGGVNGWSQEKADGEALML